MTDQKETDNKLVQGYKSMVRRIENALEHLGKKVKPKLAEQLKSAKDKSVDLGELTEEEALNIAKYIERDIEAIAEFLVDAQELISERLYVDKEEVEARLKHIVAALADKNLLEYQAFQTDLAQHAPLYYTHEIIGHGSLACCHCKQELVFVKVTQIPTCPKCGLTTFYRVKSLNS